ncbi:putative Ser/Thr phosphatase-family protein [uncultured Desulfobacterium sp.]|uniref:Putative Ser/Thr phosphatase-family protein n=1 Tax=uncultured Desulfobacterium sp. TaxID=201089 RepID=A0A445MTC8_9BACT|nr:putative Ser/Thr phosphatase-family protein [uncultured Desulfobacterium sp.]
MNTVNVLILILAINGVPALLGRIFPGNAGVPLDRNYSLSDGLPILGIHKTIRGLLSGVLTGGIFGYLIGLSLVMGLCVGLLSMMGDILSSFIKRRLGLPEGTDVAILDQVFEGGFPLLLLCLGGLLSCGSAFGVLLIFILVCWVFSKFTKIPAAPRRKSPPYTVRSSSRFREWRSCHTALSPFVRLLNFENFIYYRWFMKGVFKCIGVYGKGERNALRIRIRSIDLSFPTLPEAFNGYRILFISDLHIDGLKGLKERLIDLVSGIKTDICLLGGDYRMEMYGRFTAANEKLGELVKHINTEDGVFGILGNHDCLEIAPELEDSGIYMLINDSYTLERDGQLLSIVGTDDPHYYQCSDLDKAFEEVPENAFSILLAHSPEIIEYAEGRKIDLCLCGHTHGGQICLPVIGPLFTHSRVARRFTAGLWRYDDMVGYTTYGAGASGIPVRFNCMAEVVIVTLRRGDGTV